MTRILVVDDEPHLRLVLRKQLELDGCTVTTAEDGFKAIAAMQTETPDLVILDIMMPNMDGREVIRWMRKSYRTASVPVIFLTARSGQTEKIAGLVEGAHDYLTKPYEAAELRARVRNTLQLAAMQRQASPLTGLPGNQVIQQELSRRISGREAFAFVYVDLDYFKSFNDYYGYQRGDEVICRTSSLLCDILDELCGGEGFVGHVGGDDFVLITGGAHGLEVGEEITERFERLIPELYDDADRARGYIEVADRRGTINRFPFISVTVAVVRDDGGRYQHVAEISEVASELKRYGKSQKGSVVLHDRRGDGATTRADDSA